MTSRAQRRSPFPAGLAAGAVVLAVLVVSAAGTTRASATATGAPTLRELLGQRFVVAMRGTAPSSPLLARIRRGEVGGVVLFGSNVQSPSQLRSLTATLQRAAREAGRPPLLVATDQEGGRVRRLRWAGPEQSAVELGRSAPGRIRAEGWQAGLALRAAGINVDLAPVADVPIQGSFMAAEQRTFAATGTAVGGAATAFARGLADARVAAALKHFPGIGRATRNTDRSAVEITASRQALERDLAPFRVAVRGGAPIVMVSNATYPEIDSKPAGWSARVLDLLRNELGFRGVTITDALDGAAATRGRTLPSVAALSATAGVDLLLLTGSEASSAAAFEHVLAVAERGGLARPALLRSYGRILELKHVYG
jgi:beta-N-acetylhexosaminidase